MSEQGLGVLRAACADNRHRHGVTGLVAKGDAKPESQKQRENEYPEHDFRFALELEHARHQKMAVSGPAAIAARRLGWLRLSFDGDFLCNAHKFICVARSAQ